MNICIIGKVSPIQGGVSQLNFWICYALAKKGHNVYLVTNAEEIDEEFKIINGSIPFDMKNTPLEEVSGNIKIFHTDKYAKYNYIPYANPFVTKISSIAIDVVKNYNCEMILGHYMEPYGVAAYIASQVTGVPFGLKHAGSDVGRLLLSKEHKTLYKEIFLNASFILATNSTTRRFISAGVDPLDIFQVSPPTTPEFIYNNSQPPLDIENYLNNSISELKGEIYKKLNSSHGYENFTKNAPCIGIYGKFGASKGSYDLINALGKLKRDGYKFNFLALTNGSEKDMNNFILKVHEAGITENTIWLPFMPHWKVPSFIRLCDAVCFLERGFSIPIHFPGVSAEVMRCGTCLILSEEIYEKQKVTRKLEKSKNVIVVEPRNIDSLSEALIFVCENRGLASSIGEAGFETISSTMPKFDTIIDFINEKFKTIQEEIKLKEYEMSMIEFQSFIGRLYTDDSFRELNNISPDSAYKFYNLSAQEKENIKNINKESLEEYAYSLKLKMFDKVKRYYPCSAKSVDSDVFFNIFERFYGVNPSYPGESKVSFINKFGQFLEDSFNALPEIVEYAVEIAIFERIKNSLNFTSNPDDDFDKINFVRNTTVTENSVLAVKGDCQVVSFSYDIAVLCEKISNEEEISDLEKEEVTYVMFTVPNEANMKTLQINTATAVLIDILKNRMNISKLVEKFEDKTGIQDSYSALLEAVEYFAHEGLVNVLD